MEQEPRQLDRVRASIRTKRYSIRTEQAYVDWIRRFILFHGKRYPIGMEKTEIEKFLTHLAVNRNVAASTQNQALCALLFLYRDVLGRDMPWLDDATRAKKPRRLRVHDIDRRQIMVRNGKGGKDRVTVLAGPLMGPLRRRIEQVRIIHEIDISGGFGAVYLPFALERKYPSTAKAGGWQYLFPADKRALDPETVRFDVIAWVRMCCSGRSNGPCGMRVFESLPPVIRCDHSFATHLLERGIGLYQSNWRL
jgi:integrase